MPYDFNPAELDFVLITHAHIDHIGLLPKLVKHGFRGPIYLTNETSAVAYHLLLDSAKIQENNLRDSRWRPSRGKLIYDTTDALETIALFRPVKFDDEVNIDGVVVKFERAGHALGAASIMCKVDSKIIYFSGDLGRSEHPFLQPFDLAPRNADFVIMESLYGGIYHEQRAETIAKFERSINDIFNRNGNVIIPAFALQRTQEILYTLKKSYQDKQINKLEGVNLDSPLAQKITEVYTHSIFLNNSLGKDLFEFEQLRFIRNPKKLTRSKFESSIIIAGSGMCEGGRILGHLNKYLPDPRNGVLIVGFQAEGTLGRELLSGAKSVTINKKSVPVRAEIEDFLGFSAHADHKDLTLWLNRFDKKNLRKIFLVHAETERMDAFIDKENLKNSAYAPEWKEEIVLD